MKRPLVPCAGAYILGILFACSTAIPVALAIVASLAGALLAILAAGRRRAVALTMLLVAVFFLGCAVYRYQALPAPDHIIHTLSGTDEEVVLKGTVIDDPLTVTTFYKALRKSFILDAHTVRQGTVWRKVSGLVQVNLYTAPSDDEDLAFGDEVVLEGTLAAPVGLRNPGLFDYAAYLRNKRIYATLKVPDGAYLKKGAPLHPDIVKDAAYAVRHMVRRLIDRSLAAPYNGFMKAILIGDRSTLEEGLSEDFTKTGTVHVLAISGLHVGIIASIVLFLAWIAGLPRRASLIVTAAFLIFYSLVAGANPPIIRAVILFVVFAIGYIARRDADALNTLALAVILILIINPHALFEPGLQLSFLSVGSIIVLEPRIRQIIARDHFLVRSVTTSLAAWLGVAPIVAYYFNIVSPVAILANLIVIPALVAITALAASFLALNLISGATASLVSFGLTKFTALLFMVNGFLARLPLAYFRVAAPDAFFFTAYYLFLAALLLSAEFSVGRMRLRRTHVILAALLVLNAAVWAPHLSRKAAVLDVAFPDAGQGDAAVVTFPSGGVLVIDASTGGEEGKFDVGRSVIAPLLWNSGVTTIDALLVTHFHDDHLGGVLYLLKEFDVRCVIDSGAVPEDRRLYDAYRAIIAARKIRRVIVRRGDELRFTDGVAVSILNPPRGDDVADSNDRSIVARIRWQGRSILFCADVKEEGMADILASGVTLGSDVMKVPHHGGLLGDQTVVKNFFEAVKPSIAVIDVGSKNRWHMPSPATVAALSSVGAKVYQTKESGLIKISVSKKSVSVGTYIK